MRGASVAKANSEVNDSDGQSGKHDSIIDIQHYMQLVRVWDRRQPCAD